jgi:hypothetical protein
VPYFGAMFRDQVKFPFERKMVRNIAWGLLILTVAACAERKPEGILTEKQMVNVMTELYLAEEKAGKLPIQYDSLQKLIPMFSAMAFEKTGISDTLFRKSFDYYMSEPAKLEDIYTILVDSLNLKAQRVHTPKQDVVPR